MGSTFHSTLKPIFMGMVLCLLLTACSTAIDLMAATPGPANNTTTTTSTNGAQNVSVFVEPDAGDAVIVDAIHGAKKSALLEMYLLTDTKIISALEEAASHNVTVRVMLETHPYGSGSISPTETLDKLKAAGVQAQPASPNFSLTHEKGMVIDASTAYIMTSNFTLSALGVSKTTLNREYGIIDPNPQDVQTVTDIFNADWNHSSIQQIDDPNLVVSPVNSRSMFLALINSAHKSLTIEAEEMQDSEVEQALVNASKHGVQVQVILPTPSGGASDTNSDGITTIHQGSTQVKEDARLYMHAKIIIVDGQKAFVGSENISTASLNRNRELGIVVSDSGVLTTLSQTFQADWSDSHTV
jgi:phosphatidylserine/phosphatidylglycerophosphate/cardiolipin synthase-like enzyme